MLTHLSIRNLTTVDTLDLDLSAGNTALTGETGAGKSVLLGAIAMIAGDRADADRVRHGQDKADITATFDVSKLAKVQQWLADHELDNQELTIRRVISRDGRSKAFINGVSSPLTLLKQLTPLLIHIHSQHEHQRLDNEQYQLSLLDYFADLAGPAAQLRQISRDWRASNQQLNSLINDEQAGEGSQLLQYQLQELDALELLPDEVTQLEAELKLLSSADESIIDADALNQLLSGSDFEQPNLESMLARAIGLAEQLQTKGANVDNLHRCLNDSLISAQEASSEAQHLSQQLTADPQRLALVEQRLGAIYDVARKHRVLPEQLTEHHQSLLLQQSALSQNAEQIAALEIELDALYQDWLSLATKVHKQRKQQAKHLNVAVEACLNKLGMEGAKFDVSLDQAQCPTPRDQGVSTISFGLATSPAAPVKPVGKVASGGELSRISLALQTVTQAVGNVPTMIFDEVDAGIGGETGHVVGELLAELGKHGQVIAVTHLAQVAAKAAQQLFIGKELIEGIATTSLQYVDGEHRISEIARMMGTTGTAIGDSKGVNNGNALAKALLEGA